jgi:protein involved in polysaccharide export with SLBB domain
MEKFMGGNSKTLILIIYILLINLYIPLISQESPARSHSFTFVHSVSDDSIKLSEKSKKIKSSLNKDFQIDSLAMQSTPQITTWPPVFKKENCFFGYNFKKRLDSVKEKARDNNKQVIDSKDILRLKTWGLVSFQYDLDVDRQGNIYVPEMGQCKIEDMTLAEAEKKVKQWLGKKYIGLVKSPPTIFMDLSLKKWQQVKIHVLGEVENSGEYSVKKRSNIFELLYNIGGLNRSASLRNIKLIRGKELIQSIDLYDFLINGEKSSPTFHLQNNDILFIPLRGKTVKIEGCVQKPCVYELKPGESLNELIQFAGGICEDSNVKTIQIKPSRSKETLENTGSWEISKAAGTCLENFVQQQNIPELNHGDRVKILCEFDIEKKYVVVKGAVARPDTFEIKDSPLTIKELIDRAGGVHPNAYLGRSEIFRRRPDQNKQLLAINLNKALQGYPHHNLKLQKFDVLKVYPVQEIINTYPVYITGPVKNPGKHKLMGNMTVYDLLFKGAGEWDSAFRKRIHMDRADIIRELPDGINDTTIAFNLAKAVQNKGFGKKLLQPYDSLIIYPKQINKVDDKYVKITGYIKKPGRYNYTENMTLEDAILAAQGFRAGACTNRIEVNRVTEPENDEKELQKYKTIFITSKKQEEKSGNAFNNENLAIGIEARNFKLKHRDIIRIKKDPEYVIADTVSISGEIYYPGVYTLLNKNESLYELIKRAGGLRKNAYVRGIQLIRDGEKIAADFIELLKYKNDNKQIKLQPGDIVHIPARPNLINVKGNVGSQGPVHYIEGKRLFYYLNKKGGPRDNSQNIYLIYPNNEVEKISKFFGFYVSNPVVPDGSEILVTDKKTITLKSHKSK